MNVKEKILGTTITCEVRRADYTKYFGKEVTDSLVQFNHNSGIVTVDERTSENYAKYSAIHECICCGKFADLVPRNGDDDISRCSRVEQLVMDSMPESYRIEYSTKRREMFSTLLEKGLNPSLNESFKCSLKFHENFLKGR